METGSSSRGGRVGNHLKHTAKQPQRGGGGGGFGDRWTPPESGQALVPILLFPGTYSMAVKLPEGGAEKVKLPYAIVVEHYSKKSNSFARCIAGLKYEQDAEEDLIIVPGDKPCVGCYEYAKGKQTGVSQRKLHVFNGILLADFHWVEQTSRRGTKYKEPVQCTGKRCKLCKQGSEKSFGRRVFWPLGPSFVDMLGDFDMITLARECKCGGTIEPIAFECPECKMPFRDLEDDPVHNEEELMQLRMGIFNCQTDGCGYRGFMDEVPECSDCRTAQPLKLWDVAMEVYRSGEGAQSSLQISRYKYYSPEKRAAIAELMKPIDPNNVYPILNLDAQAKRLGKDNPFNGTSNGAGSDEDRPYAQEEEVHGSAAWDNL